MGHLNCEKLKVHYPDVSVIQMFVFLIPTLYLCRLRWSGDKLDPSRRSFTVQVLRIAPNFGGWDPALDLSEVHQSRKRNHSQAFDWTRGLSKTVIRFLNLLIPRSRSSLMHLMWFLYSGDMKSDHLLSAFLRNFSVLGPLTPWCALGTALLCSSRVGLWFLNGGAIAIAMVPTIRKLDNLVLISNGFWQNCSQLSGFHMLGLLDFRFHSKSRPFATQPLFRPFKTQTSLDFRSPLPINSRAKYLKLH